MADEAEQEYKQLMEKDYMEMIKGQAQVFNDFRKTMAEFIKVGKESSFKYLMNSADEVRMKLQEKYPDEYISKRPTMIIAEDIKNESKRIEDQEEKKQEEKLEGKIKAEQIK